MSEAFIGANVGELQNLAARLDQTYAEGIANVIKQVEGEIGNLDALWKGNDANQFRDEWTNQHRQALQNAVEALRKAAGDARKNAEIQTQTSSTM